MSMTRSPWNRDQVGAYVSSRAGQINLNDVTLRDGEQAVDVAFTVDEKVRITEQLQEVGLDQAQVGYPLIDGAETTRRIKASGLTIPVELLCVGFGPDWQEQIKETVACGADSVHIFVRSSKELLAFIDLDEAAALNRTEEACALAVAEGARHVTFGPTFATEADPEFLKKMCRTAVDAGADRIVFCDSMGVTRPSAVAAAIRMIIDATSASVGAHCHNDYGLGVACALAAAEAGADWIDVSVGGLGERGGNSNLEQVVIALANLYDSPTGVDTTQLLRLRQFVWDILKRDVVPGDAVVGENAFAQKLDIHARAFITDPELFEPYLPEVVGHRRVLRLGKGSGPLAVQTKLEELGQPVPPAEQVKILVGKIGEYAESHKTYVPDELFNEWLSALPTS